MIIVAGTLTVAPEEREAYLATSTEAVEQARAAAGCLDFAVSPDLVDPGRINVFELWSDAESLAEFRGSGPSGDQMSMILDASVIEYAVELTAD